MYTSQTDIFGCLICLVSRLAVLRYTICLILRYCINANLSCTLWAHSLFVLSTQFECENAPYVNLKTCFGGVSSLKLKKS